MPWSAQPTAVQVSAIDASSIGALTSIQLIALSTAQFAQLSITQLQAIAGAKIAAIELTDIAALGSSQWQGLSASQVNALTTAQLRVLHSTKAATLSTAQIAAGSLFTPTQLSGLSANQTSALYYSPLVFDLDGNGIRTLSVDRGVKFDLNADGRMDQTGWVASGDGLLARDLNQDGQ
ncbi:MAG: hypothetical protein EBV49_16615, partial [Betaproteobacteria bacterium]|nr:hypothetical protein [Betaproteobacteria bacterium]